MWFIWHQLLLDCGYSGDLNWIDLLSKGVVTNYGRGVAKRVGGHVKFYPYEKGGRWEKI